MPTTMNGRQGIGFLRFGVRPPTLQAVIDENARMSGHSAQPTYGMALQAVLEENARRGFLPSLDFMECP